MLTLEAQVKFAAASPTIFAVRGEAARALTPALVSTEQAQEAIHRVKGLVYQSPGYRPTTTAVMTGTPDPDHISTSCVERANLTMRMSMRRFTRLTSGFSKKAENHTHAVAIHFMYDNFGRYHQTLRSTPAMRAGVTDHRWSLEEIVRLAN